MNSRAALALFFLAFAALAVPAAAFVANSASYNISEFDSVQVGQGAGTTHQATSTTYNLTLVTIEQPVGWSYDAASTARACLGPLCRVATMPPYYLARVEDCICTGAEFGTDDLTVKINGVETDTMESAFEPYNLTINTSVRGKRLIVCERGGNMPFAFSQMSGTALVSSAVAEAGLGADKYATMAVIPSGDNHQLYPLGFVYLITVELHDTMDDLIACKNITVATDAHNYIGNPSFKAAVPNPDNILAANDRLVNAYLHIKSQDPNNPSKGGNESIVTIYSDGTQTGLNSLTANADGVIAMKVRVLDVLTGAPIPQTLIWFVERNSYMHWAAPQYQDPSYIIFNRAAGRSLTDANGWANVTIMPTGGGSDPLLGEYNVTIVVNIPPFTKYVYKINTGLRTYPNTGYSQQVDSNQLPNSDNFEAGRDMLVNMFLIVRCWLNYPFNC